MPSTPAGATPTHGCLILGITGRSIGAMKPRGSESAGSSCGVSFGAVPQELSVSEQIFRIAPDAAESTVPGFGGVALTLTCSSTMVTGPLPASVIAR